MTRSAAQQTTWSRARLASRSVKGKRVSPESFSRWMWFSQLAWARLLRSR